MKVHIMNRGWHKLYYLPDKLVSKQEDPRAELFQKHFFP